MNLIAALKDSKSPYDLVRMPVLTLERNSKFKRRRSRWPHQRFAAGLAHNEICMPLMTNYDQTAQLENDRKSIDHQINDNTNNIDLLYNNINPAEQNELDEKCMNQKMQTDQNHLIGQNNDDLLLEHGLVVFPNTKNENSFDSFKKMDNLVRNGDGDVGCDPTASGDVEDCDFQDNEELFKLKYYKKPFFSWF